MPDSTSSLDSCLQKAREQRITEGFGLFLLTKLPQIHDYRLINTNKLENLKLWLATPTHKFACIIDPLDILLIDSTLPFDKLHYLFSHYELLPPDKQPHLSLLDFLEEIKQTTDA